MHSHTILRIPKRTNDEGGFLREVADMSRFDLVIRGGTVVTAADRFPADIGIRDGRIVALGDSLDRAEEELDASGKLVLPGGIDSHVHLDQPSPETGARSANDFRSGSISAACGGNTTILPFVRQLKGQSLRRAVEEYHERAHGRSAIDYAFHLIIADATAQVLGQDLPALIQDGYTSVKVYMTYDSLKLADGEILRVLDVVREHGAMTMVHAENADCIAWLTEKLLDRGHTAPKFKTVAHAPPEEREATHRAITLAELAGVPILIVHVASGEAAQQIQWAQRRGLRVYAETCPQYPVPDRGGHRQTGDGGRQVHLRAAPGKFREPASVVDGAGDRGIPGVLVRSRSVSL